MKVSTSVKQRCKKCQLVRRGGVLVNICDIKRHKSRQG